MVERDPLQHAYQATVPTDLEDPPQFGQVLETIRDALALELRAFFRQPQLNIADAARRREIPTVRKYAVGFDPGTDPYATVQRIVQDHADIGERLPHVAVTAVQGQGRRMTIGQPYVAAVQTAPYVITADAEPFSVSSVAAEVWEVVVNSAAPGTRYAVTILGADAEYTAQVGDTTALIAQGLLDALQVLVGDAVFVSRSANTLVLTAAEANVPLGVSVAGGDLTATLVTAAGVGQETALEFWLTYLDDVESRAVTVTLPSERFQDPNAISAADLARVFNERSKRRVTAEAQSDGRVKFSWVADPRPFGRIESRSTLFGLGTSGVGYTAAGTTLTAVGVGTAVLAALPTGAGAGVQAQVLLDGLPMRVASVTDADTVELEDLGLSNPTGTWFVGLVDSWRNAQRPVMNRRHACTAGTASVSILAESPTERDELHDLVLNHFLFFLETKHFQLLGRGILDPETYPNELWHMSVASEVATGGQAIVAREGDTKGPIYEARISIPVTLWMLIDRALIVPSGPRAGQPYVVLPADITAAAPLSE